MGPPRSVFVGNNGEHTPACACWCVLVLGWSTKHLCYLSSEHSYLCICIYLSIVVCSVTFWAQIVAFGVCFFRSSTRELCWPLSLLEQGGMPSPPMAPTAVPWRQPLATVDRRMHVMRLHFSADDINTLRSHQLPLVEHDENAQNKGWARAQFNTRMLMVTY